MNSDRSRRLPPEGEDTLQQEVAEWLVRKDKGLASEEELRKVDLRREQDPDFDRALRQAEGAWDMLGRLPAEKVSAMLEQEEAEEKTVWGVFANWKTASAGLVAGILVLFLILQISGISIFSSSSHDVIPVNGSNPSTYIFSDGSLARLNVATTLEEEFSENQRLVRLLEGEAHFMVKKDADRPFVVMAKGVRVVAVGTAFDISLKHSEVGVLVTEGVVQIQDENEDPIGISNGSRIETRALAVEQGYVTSGQRATVVTRSTTQGEESNMKVFGTVQEEVDAILAWQHPLLTLEGDSLGTIAENFKMKTGLELIIQNPEFRHIQIGGRFSSDDPKRFLEILRINYGISWYERSDGALVIGEESP